MSGVQENFVRCEVCGEWLTRKGYKNHLAMKHGDVYFKKKERGREIVEKKC